MVFLAYLGPCTHCAVYCMHTACDGSNLQKKISISPYRCFRTVQHAWTVGDRIKTETAQGQHIIVLAHHHASSKKDNSNYTTCVCSCSVTRDFDDDVKSHMEHRNSLAEEWHFSCWMIVDLSSQRHTGTTANKLRCTHARLRPIQPVDKASQTCAHSRSESGNILPVASNTPCNVQTAFPPLRHIRLRNASVPGRCSEGAEGTRERLLARMRPLVRLQRGAVVGAVVAVLAAKGLLARVRPLVSGDCVFEARLVRAVLAAVRLLARVDQLVGHD